MATDEQRLRSPEDALRFLAVGRGTIVLLVGAGRGRVLLQRREGDIVVAAAVAGRGLFDQLVAEGRILLRGNRVLLP